MRTYTWIIWIIGFGNTICHNCIPFWNRWHNCPLMKQFPPSKFLCFNSDDGEHLIVATEDNLVNMQCNYRPADVEFFPCVKIGEVSRIIFGDCLFPTTFLADYVSQTKVSSFSVTYNRTNIINHHMIIDNLKFLQEIIIVGAISSVPIDIKFENLPMIKIISLYRTNFSNFVFGNLPELKKLALVNCSINHLSQLVFGNFSRIILLNLGENFLQEFSVDSFEGLNSLQILHLHRNRFKEVESSWFSSLSKLRYLNLRQNQIITIDPDLFRILPELKVLNISYNSNFEFNNDTFHEILTLEEVRADSCSFSSLPSSLFQNVLSLNRISFQNNEISSIPTSLFRSNLLLESISFESNKLNRIEKGMFSHLKTLKFLLLGRNRISHISLTSFSDLSSLIYLDLHSNKLETLDTVVFRNLTNLRSLDLSFNQLKFLTGDFPFGRSLYLSLVNLSRNNMFEFPSISWNFSSAFHLDISHNYLSNLKLTVSSRNQASVDMKFNPVSIISLEHIYNSNTEEPVVYKLENSTFSCNCSLQGFLEFLKNPSSQTVFPDNSTMMCSNPAEMKGTPLITISPIYSICPSKLDCPDHCHCYQNVKEEIIVDCQRKNLSEVPIELPPQSAIVYLDNNNIRRLKIDFKYWENITELSLGNNYLSSLRDWRIPSNLRILNVSHNKLYDLPPSLMDLIGETTDFELYLANNSWMCDCRSAKFKRWYTENKKKIKDLNRTYCLWKTGSKSIFIEQLIKEVSVDLFCTGEPMLSNSQIVVIYSSVISVFILLLCSAIFCYRFGNLILAFLYSRNLYCNCFHDHSKEEEKPYDAFICYNSADREVMMDILEHLEPTYRLCVHERDWIPGYPICHQIVKSVQDSRKTVILLSKDFLDSLWFQVEFRTAYNQMMEDKKHRLVLVIIGKLDNVNNLEKDLRHLLSTKTYLQWGEKWFWEKFRYTLRHRHDNKKHFQNSNQLHVQPVQMD